MRPKYKLISDQGDEILATIIIAALVGIALHEYIFYCIASAAFILALGIFTTIRRPKLLIYENGFKFCRSLNKASATRLQPFSDIEIVLFKMSSGVGSNRLTIKYTDNQKAKQTSLVFKAFVPKNELSFLESQGVKIIFDLNGER